MTCKELAEILLKTPDMPVQASFSDRTRSAISFSFDAAYIVHYDRGVIVEFEEQDDYEEDCEGLDVCPACGANLDGSDENEELHLYWTCETCGNKRHAVFEPSDVTYSETIL